MFDSSKILRDLESQIASKQWIKEKDKQAGSGITVIPEDRQRARLLALAKMQGCQIELQAIFDKYDNLLRGCTDKKEKAHIAYLGISECAKLLNTSQDLVVNGYIIQSNQENDYDIINKKK